MGTGPTGPFGPYIWLHGRSLGGNILGTPLPPGEVQYTAGYNEEVTAVSGSINYQKTMSIRPQIKL